MSLHRRVKDESVTSLGCVCCGFGLLLALLPWASLCVQLCLGVPLEGRLSWGHRRAAQGVLGVHRAGTVLSCCPPEYELTSWSASWALLPFIKGEKSSPESPPQSRKVWRPVINALQCAVTETAESCSGRGSQSCQQGGHRLHCQAALGRMVQPEQLWLSWDAAGAAPDTRSCWIVH